MVLALGIEMATGCGERGSITLRILMNVNGVHTWRKILNIKLNVDALPTSNGRKHRRPNAFSRRILQFDLGLLRKGEYSGARESSNQRNCFGHHTCIYNIAR